MSVETAGRAVSGALDSGTNLVRELKHGAGVVIAAILFTSALFAGLIWWLFTVHQRLYDVQDKRIIDIKTIDSHKNRIIGLQDTVQMQYYKIKELEEQLSKK